MRYDPSIGYPAQLFIAELVAPCVACKLEITRLGLAAVRCAEATRVLFGGCFYLSP